MSATPPKSGSRSKKLDRLALANRAEYRPDSLVGSYFHTFEADGAVKWQGCVVAEPHPGYYLVELFEWFAGSSSDQHLVRIEDMLGWVFYDDAEWMGNAYEHGLSQRTERALKGREQAGGKDA